MSGYESRTVLVTGASRGIGLAVAQRFEELGAAVGLVASDGARLTQAASTLSGRCHWVAADLSDPGECRRAVDEVEAVLGPVDVLVSCAGVLRRDFVEDVAVADFEHSYRLNAGAGLWLSQRVLPGMRARGRGSIVLVSSELGLIGGPTYASYCTSKWALVGLAEVLHHELAGSGVSVCAVCPGDVRTDQLAQEHAWGPTGGESYEKAMAPATVARAIVRATGGPRPVVVVDKPHLRVAFNLMGGPRRLRLAVVGSAFKTLLRERAPRAAPPAPPARKRAPRAAPPADGDEEQGEPSPGSRWRVIAAYALVAGATQMLWLTFAAITTTSARHYGVSVTAIGWLAEIFPLLYVLLAIPSGALLDRYFRGTLVGGTALLAAGAVVRLGGPTFAWAMTGQVMIAVAQPVILSALTRLAGDYLRAGDRADGIAIGSAGNFVGMLLALLLGPLIADHGHLERLLAVEAVLAVLAAIGLAIVLRRPGHASGERSALAGNAARTLWGLTEMRNLCWLVFLGFGIFVAIATWLQTLLAPASVSETTAGVLLVGMVIAGVFGCAVLAPRVSERGTERSYMLVTVAVTLVGCLACGVSSALGVRAGALLCVGVVLLAALPIVLTRCELLAGPLAASAGAIVWLAGNLGGLLVALVVQALVHHPFPAFVAMAAVALCGLPIALRLPRAAARAAQAASSA